MVLRQGLKRGGVERLQEGGVAVMMGVVKVVVMGVVKVTEMMMMTWHGTTSNTQAAHRLSELFYARFCDISPRVSR